MHMNELYKRRIRIVGKSDEMQGWMLTVHDSETGEAITNVREVIVYLSVEHDNTAEVTYYEMNDAGHLVKGPHGPVSKTVMLPDPEIDVPAYEYRSNSPADQLDRSSWWTQT